MLSPHNNILQRCSMLWPCIVDSDTDTIQNILSPEGCLMATLFGEGEWNLRPLHTDYSALNHSAVPHHMAFYSHPLSLSSFEPSELTQRTINCSLFSLCGVCVCMQLCVCICVCTQRPEISITCLPPWLSILYFETGYLIEPGAQWLG